MGNIFVEFFILNMKWLLSLWSLTEAVANLPDLVKNSQSIFTMGREKGLKYPTQAEGVTES